MTDTNWINTPDWCEYRGLCIAELLWEHDPMGCKSWGVPDDEYEADGLEFGRWLCGHETIKDIVDIMYGALLGKWGHRPDRERLHRLARDIRALDRLTL